MNLATLPPWAADLLGAGRVGRLAFADADGHPRVLPITYAVVAGTIWSAVDQKPKGPGEPARVRWLRERPSAALVVDRYSDDWTQLAWVQLLGAVELLDLPAGAEAVAALTDKYEQYRSEPPPGPLLRLEVERALWWRASSDAE
jgi:PPOX class probable F420-dependent enzyme